MFPADILSLAEKTVKLLTERGETLSTAESCTGGMIAAALTEAAGASRVFRYGWVTYARESKERELGVPAELIERHTVVSEPVVQAMAESALEQAHADYALAVSGNAGPTAPPGEPPVGTVCIALATPGGTYTTTLVRPHLSRHDFRAMVVREALELLLRQF